jgi:hypothetical protein
MRLSVFDQKGVFQADGIGQGGAKPFDGHFGTAQVFNNGLFYLNNILQAFFVLQRNQEYHQQINAEAHAANDGEHEDMPTDFIRGGNGHYFQPALKGFSPMSEKV